MITRKGGRFLAGLLTAALWLGCSGDGGGAGGGDASPDADPGPDAFDPCPGAFTFEALVADVLSGEPVPLATVSDLSGEESAMSAPNGRALLCLEDGGDRNLQLSEADYLTTLYALDGEAAAAHLGSGPFPAPMITGDGADALVTSTGETRDESEGLLLVEVMSYPGASPGTGAEVTIGATHDGAFVEDSEGDWVAGSELTDGYRVLFVNVDRAGGSSALDVTPPPGQICAAADVPLEGGAFSYTFVACNVLGHRPEPAR